MNITRRYEIDMGHCLADHRGKCFRPHGHRYAVEATVNGEVATSGAERHMVIDFANLTAVLAKVLEPFDHRFVIEKADQRCEAVRTAFGEGMVIVLNDGAPTAENLSALWGRLIASLVPAQVTVVGVRVYETPNCWADWSP